MNQHKARGFLATLVFFGLAGGAAQALAGEIRGRVISEDKAVAGATVAALPFESPFEEARREARRGPAPAPLATATTKADGSYVLAVPAPTAPTTGAMVRLQVTAKGLRSTLLDAVYDAAETAEAGDAILGKSGALAGKVVDRQGGPVVGASVTLASSAFPFNFSGASGIVPAATTTGADGTFRFAEAGTNGNRVRVEAPGFAFAEASGLVAGAVRRPLTLALGRTISGTVVGEGRKPAAGALVRFETGNGSSRWFEARGDGSFLVEGVPPEGGTIVADAGDKGRGTVVLEAGVGKATVVLSPTASIGGRVVDSRSGAPIPRVRVVARGEGALFFARSGPDGRYEIKGLPVNAYQLGADDPAYVSWSRENVQVKSALREDQDVILTRAASLVGRVVDENGAPVEGATGMLTPSGETGPRAFFRRVGFPGMGSAFRTGADGSFKATRLGPGTNQTLTVRHRDHETRTIGGVSLSGSAPTRVNVVLRRGQTIRGLVKDDRGQPVAGADVSLQREFRMESRRGMTSMSFVTGDFGRPPQQTGVDGRFEVKGLASGDYTLQVSKRGYTRERIDPVKVAEDRVLEPFEVVLRTGATISGFLRDKAGNGAPGQRVGARPAGSAGRNMPGPMGGPMTEEPTGPDGAFVIEGVVPGETYELQVFGETGLGARKSGVTAPAEGVELLASGKGAVRGAVRDAESGRPLRDFTVSYRPSQQGGGMQVRFGFGGPRRGMGQPVPFHTDDGGFLVDEVPPGKWDVEVAAEGYQSGRANGITVDEGAVAEGVEVRLSRGSVLSGRVSEARSGQPVRDASIRAQIAGGNAPPMRFGPMEGDGRQASSDADGRFELPGLAPGTYTVTATHSDWTETSQSVEVKEAAATVDIKMTAGAAIAGSVTGASQRPVAGATVSVSAAGAGGPFGAEEQSTISDAGGRFRFERLGPGRYSVIASLRTESSSPAEVVVQAGDGDKSVSLSLRAGATLRGTVSGLPEAQRGNVSISASGPEEYFANTRTSSAGTFELSGVPTGPIMLRANAGDFMTSSRGASAQVVVAEGQAEVTADIVFEDGFRLDGHVTRAGKPVAEAMVNASPEGGSGGRGAMGRTDGAGAFALEGLAAGSYFVTAFSPSGGASIRKKVEVAGDTNVELEAPPARLTGTVVEQGTGRPLGEAEVRLEIQETPGGRGPMAMMNAQSTDSAGRFLFEDLEPSAYRISVTKPAFQTELRQVNAGDEADLVVEMKRGEGIGIVARDGIYQVPLRSLFVGIADGQGANAFAGSVALDSDGQGEIPSLRPGSYQLRATAQGYAPAGPVPITVPSSTVSLVLTPGGTLEIQAGPETMAAANPAGRILLASGAPYVPGPFGGQGPQAGLIRFTSPIRRIENIGPGSYVFAVENGPRKPFEIREGGTATVVFP